MKIVRMSLFVASAFCVTHFCASLAAEEIKYPSPDRRFALRITAPQEGAGRKVDLIEKDSGKVMIDLGTAWPRQILVWSPDSKRVAYGCRGGKGG